MRIAFLFLREYCRSKTGRVKTDLAKAKVAIREKANRQKFELGRTKHKYCGTVPFGYAYLEGQLVMDPKEYQIVLQMLRRWIKGDSYRSIARYLNDQIVKPRRGLKWHHEVVKQIVQRHHTSEQNRFWQRKKERSKANVKRRNAS